MQRKSHDGGSAQKPHFGQCVKRVQSFVLACLPFYFGFLALLHLLRILVLIIQGMWSFVSMMLSLSSNAQSRLEMILVHGQRRRLERAIPTLLY